MCPVDSQGCTSTVKNWKRNLDSSVSAYSSRKGENVSGLAEEAQSRAQIEKGAASLALEPLGKQAMELTRGCCRNHVFRDGMWELPRTTL